MSRRARRPDTPPSAIPLTLSAFLDQFADALAARLQSEIPVLFDPTTDHAAATDRGLATLTRPLYPAQAAAVAALIKAFCETRQRAIYLVGEQGIGKTAIALGLLACTPRPWRVLVQCPPHLTEKWAREARAVLGAVAVTSLSGRTALGTLLALAARHKAGFLAPPTVPEVWIIGRERAKLSYAWRPAFTWRTRRARDKAGALRTWREPACAACGATLLDSENVPIDDEALRRRRTRCVTCQSPAWTADRNGPRRYAPALFIRKRLRGVFDLLVLDECHEMKGAETGQGHAFGSLTRACRRTLAMTGTLAGGYADHLFHLLFRSHTPTLLADGFSHRGVERWMQLYGVLQRVIRRPLTDDTTQTRGRRQERVSVKRRPGISPVVLGQYLLPNTIFLRLSDVAAWLPPYEERVVSLAMTDDQAEQYTQLAADLKAEVTAALRRGNSRLLSTYLQALLSYPDAATFRPERIPDPADASIIIAEADCVPGPLPKETALIDLVHQAKARGRRVLVYCTHTGVRDLTAHLKSLLEAAGLRVGILSVHTTTAERREAWVTERVAADGLDVLITNPELVKTGLDLWDFPEIAFYETGYNIFTLRQAARRSWRIGQREPVTVTYFLYQRTMQEQAMRLIASKLESSLAIEGELTDHGLAALSDSGDTMSVALARTLVDKLTRSESAEVCWARLRAKELSQALGVTGVAPVVLSPPAPRAPHAPPAQAPDTPPPAPPRGPILIDFIETTRPRKAKISRVIVEPSALEETLKDAQGAAQLAIF